MRQFESVALRLLELADAETARNIVIEGLRIGAFLSPTAAVESSRLAVSIAGLDLKNPLGLAAGFDKDAKLLSVLPRMGFGFVEVGAVTPKPQGGNEKPRLFRLQEDGAVINRLGFNNEGAQPAAKRLANRPSDHIVGLNVGANKDSDDWMEDYVSVIRSCGDHVDFVTVNVSSPNTTGLRALQGRRKLQKLLSLTKSARNDLASPPKLFVKLAPDMPLSELREAAETAMEAELDAIIATNTMAVNCGEKFPNGLNLGLKSGHRMEGGGLSGQPLFELSTCVLGELYHITQGSVPLIGVGGITTGEDAFKKIQAGATALQIYTSLVFHGFSCISKILADLDKRLQQEGFTSVKEAIGSDNASWRLGRG